MLGIIPAELIGSAQSSVSAKCATDSAAMVTASSRFTRQRGVRA